MISPMKALEMVENVEGLEELSFLRVLLFCFCLVDCRKEFNLQMLTFCCRSWNFSTAWKNLVKSRWPNLGNQIEPIDWQQMYWETHLQKYAFFFASQWKNRDSIFCSWMICRFSCMIPQTNNSCLDEVAEIASLPSFDGRLGEIGISGTCYWVAWFLLNSCLSGVKYICIYVLC